MKYFKGSLILIGVTLYLCVMLLYTHKVYVMADELKEDVEVIVEQEEDHFEDIESMEEDPSEDLQDNIYPLSRFSDNSLGATRSVIVNTYDPTNEWLFDEVFFYRNFVNSGIEVKYYAFPKGYFGDRQEELVSLFKDSLGSGWFYHDMEKSDFQFDLICKPDYFNACYYNIQSNGYPSNNTYWEIPEVTPDPTPTTTPDPTPTPDPSDPNTPVVSSDFQTIVIFLLACVVGVLVGDVLTRFIR